MDVSFTGLRVLRAVAEQGTFTKAAEVLGYTQSAVSRQIATLESDVGRRLFERDRGGVRLTRAGAILLRHAAVALDAVEAAGAELDGTGDPASRSRLGVTPLVSALLLPGAVAVLRRRAPQLRLATREGTTSALVRALRAGTVDAAVLTSRPPHRSPDSGTPRLQVEPLLETRLAVAVPSRGRYAGRHTVSLDELAAESWIASSASGDEPLLGMWPGLPGRPAIAYLSRDWLAKLHLVAAGAGVTTIPATLEALLPGGAQLVSVADAPEEIRRISVARLPGTMPAPLATVVTALRDQAASLAG